jgi:hypothetical protein
MVGPEVFGLDFWVGCEMFISVMTFSPAFCLRLFFRFR